MGIASPGFIFVLEKLSRSNTGQSERRFSSACLRYLFYLTLMGILKDENAHLKNKRKLLNNIKLSFW